jgi:CIC family chloride channel protein
MQTGVMTLYETDSLPQAAEVLMKTRHHGLPVVNQAGELVGILTVGDIDRAHTEGDLKQTVGEACTHDLMVAYPDETINMVLRRMSPRDLGRMPVVARDDEKHLLGILRRSDVIRAYDVALARRAALRHQAHQVRLGALRGDDFSVTEIVIEPGASCEGKLVKEIAWPSDSVIASLRRGGKLMVPRGDTPLKARDVLVVVAEGRVQEQVKKLCMREDREA